MKTQKKITIHKIFLAIIFILVIGFGFGKGEKAEAATFLCYCQDEGVLNKYQIDSCEGVEDTCKNTCDSKCKGKGYDYGFTVNDSNEEKKEELKEAYSLKSYKTHKEYSCSFALDPIDCTLLTLLELFVWLTTLASTLFIWIMGPNNISSILSSKAIYEGWALVRDALNVSFIMFLLFSAFATVFQVDKYSYKKTLLWIVIMALLVNFSFPISRFIIDVSNMLMFYFVDTLKIGSDQIDAFANFASVSKLPEIMHPAVGNDTASLLAAVIFVFIFMVTMLTISILFVVRTLALAVLIIFSSLAFVGTAVPPLAKHSSDWWKKLFDYSFFGPIMLFMMYIASSLMNEIQRSGTSTMTTVATKNSTSAEYIASLGFFSLPIIILWIGLGIAKEMSGSAGSAIVGKAQGFMKWSGKNLTGYNLAKFGVKKAGHMIDRDFLAKRGLSVKTFKEAWKARQDELDKRKYGKATGAWRDRINKVMSGGKHITRFEEAAVQNHISEKEKEFENVSTEFNYLYDQYNKAKKAGKTEDMTALLRIITKTNEGNSFMITERTRELTEAGRKAGKTQIQIDADIAADQSFDPFATTDRYYDQLVAAGMSPEMAAKQVNDMGYTSIGKGMTQLHGAFELNLDNGNYEKVTDKDKRVRMVQGKVNETKAQAWADTLHWTSLFNQKGDTSVGDLHEMGESQLRNLTGAQLKQLTRVRGDAMQRIFQGLGKIKTLRNKIDADSKKSTITPGEKQELESQVQRLDVFIEGIELADQGKL